MDILAFAAFAASMFIVGELAHERGFSRRRWLWIASAIGPFAIPVIYLVEATSALRKMINARSA